jgi:hypothetical protein
MSVQLRRGNLTVEIDEVPLADGSAVWRARVVADGRGPTERPLKWEHASHAARAVAAAVKAWRAARRVAA